MPDARGPGRLAALRLADGAEAWARAKHAGQPTHVFIPQTGSYAVTEYEARILAQMWWSFFQFIA